MWMAWPSSDQRHQHAPARDALTKFDQVLRFGHPNGPTMHMRDTFGVMSALRLVKNDKVLWRNRRPGTGVMLDVVLDALNERLAATAGVLQRVLKYLYQGTVPRQVHRRRRWPAVCARHRKVIEPVRVDQLQTDQRLSRPGTPLSRTRCRVRVCAASRAMAEIYCSAGSVAALARLIIGNSRR